MVVGESKVGRSGIETAEEEEPAEGPLRPGNPTPRNSPTALTSTDTGCSWRFRCGICMERLIDPTIHAIKQPPSPFFSQDIKKKNYFQAMISNKHKISSLRFYANI